MKVNGIYNSPNFSALLVNRRTIEKYNNQKGKYDDSDAYVVMLEPTNKDDIKAVASAVDTWRGDIFGRNILDSLIFYKHFPKDSHMEVYAITTQDDNHEKLEPSKILGLAEVYMSAGSSNPYLSYFQVKPNDNRNRNIPDEYNHVGQELLGVIKKLFMYNGITTYPTPNAVPFYEHMGFRQVDKATNMYHWDCFMNSTDDIDDIDI